MIFNMRAEAQFHYYMNDQGVMHSRFLAQQELFRMHSVNKAMLAIWRSPTYPPKWFPPNPACWTIGDHDPPWTGPAFAPHPILFGSPTATDSAYETETPTPGSQNTYYSGSTVPISVSQFMAVGATPPSGPSGWTPESLDLGWTPPPQPSLAPHTPDNEEDSGVARQLFD